MMNMHRSGALCWVLVLCLTMGAIGFGCGGGSGDAGTQPPDAAANAPAAQKTGVVAPPAQVEPAEAQPAQEKPVQVEPAAEEPAPAKDEFTPAIRAIDEAAAAQVTYAGDVAPLLAAQCVPCHEGDQGAEGLDLSTVDGMLAGGEHAGPAIVAGKPDDSPLVQFIRGIKQPKMPKGRSEMTEDDLHVIRMWIAAGAKAAQ